MSHTYIGRVCSVHEWLIASMEDLDDVEQKHDPTVDDLRRCGRIVHDAGDRLARLGCYELHDKSLVVATKETHSVNGLASYVCQAGEAQTFLSTCIAHCLSAKSSSAGGKKPALAGGTGQLDQLNCYERAYHQWKEADNRFEGKATDRKAYEWLKKQNPYEVGVLAKFDTWVKYVRTARARRREQKNWQISESDRNHAMVALVEKISKLAG